MTIGVQSKQFDLGELLSATFQLLKSQFKPMLKVSLLPAVIIMVVGGVFAATVFLAIQVTGFYNPQKLDSLPMIVQISGGVITAILFAMAFSLVMIAMIQVTADSCGGQPIPATREVLRRAWGRVAALWGTWALLCLGMLVLVLLGTIFSPFSILLVLIQIPLIFAGVIYLGFALEAVSLRGVSGMAAFRYSVSLVKGRFWKTFGYLFVLGLTGWICAFIPMMLIQFVVTIVVPKMQLGDVVAIGIAAIMMACMVLFQFLFQLFILIGKTLMFLVWESSKLPGPELIQKE